MAHIEVLFQYLLEGSEESHETPQDSYCPTRDSN